MEDNKQYSKLIEHLSSEIITHTNFIIEFRTKINFTLFIGPFVILGTYLVLTQTTNINFNINLTSICSLVILCLTWLALGLSAGRFEKHILDQCNKWRNLILELDTQEEVTITKNDFIFEHNLSRAYLWVYSVLLLCFISAIIILSNIETNQNKGIFNSPILKESPSVIDTLKNL